MLCKYCQQEKENVTVYERWRKNLKRGMVYVCRECNTERKRKYRQSKHGKEAIKAASRRAYLKHREKWLARAKMRNAVKRGELHKPTKCSICNLERTLQGHHEDYTKPLEVKWLCTGCHADADRKLEMQLF